MNKNYKALVRALPKQEGVALKQEQKHWLNARREKCFTKDLGFTFEEYQCTAERTYERAEELAARLSKLKVPR